MSVSVGAGGGAFDLQDHVAPLFEIDAFVAIVESVLNAEGTAVLAAGLGEFCVGEAFLEDVFLQIEEFVCVLESVPGGEMRGEDIAFGVFKCHQSIAAPAFGGFGGGDDPGG